MTRVMIITITTIVIITIVIIKISLLSSTYAWMISWLCEGNAGWKQGVAA